MPKFGLEDWVGVFKGHKAEGGNLSRWNRRCKSRETGNKNVPVAATAGGWSEGWGLVEVRLEGNQCS